LDRNASLGYGFWINVKPRRPEFRLGSEYLCIRDIKTINNKAYVMMNNIGNNFTMACSTRRVSWTPRPKVTPEEGSMHAILIANSSQRLYIHPLEWTATHLEHLKCELRPMPLRPSHGTISKTAPIENGVLLGGIKWAYIERTIWDIKRHGDMKQKDEEVASLITLLYRAATGLRVQRFVIFFARTTPHRTITDMYLCSGLLSFKYLLCRVVTVRVPFTCHAQQAVRGLAWAYIDETWCAEERCNFHHQWRKCSDSHALCASKVANALPLDPFYAAVLIALGQKARKRGNGTGVVKVSFQLGSLASGL
jgi:hypothetical protein